MFKRTHVSTLWLSACQCSSQTSGHHLAPGRGRTLCRGPCSTRGRSPGSLKHRHGIYQVPPRWGRLAPGSLGFRDVQAPQPRLDVQPEAGAPALEPRAVRGVCGRLGSSACEAEWRPGDHTGEAHANPGRPALALLPGSLGRPPPCSGARGRGHHPLCPVGPALRRPGGQALGSPPGLLVAQAADEAPWVGLQLGDPGFLPVVCTSRPGVCVWQCPLDATCLGATQADPGARSLANLATVTLGQARKGGGTPAAGSSGARPTPPCIPRHPRRIPRLPSPHGRKTASRASLSVP